METRTAPPQEEERWGTTVVGGRPRRGRRWLRRGLVAVVVLVLLLAATGAGAALYANSRLERVEVGGLRAGTGPLHVLVVGSDSRAELTEEERRELHTGSAQGQRTDTIFVMTVGGGDVAILAFPRDLLVTRCDGSRGRINAAFTIGGPGCLVETVSELSGIPIDHYLEVDFLGFRDIVEAVGGVELCLERPIADRDAGIDLPAGCQTLDGREALGYVRVRKIDDDLARIERQQRFLRALVDEVVSPATVVNPVRLYRTAGEVGAALTADGGLGPIDLARLGWGMRGLAGGAVTETVPAEPATVGGAAVLEPLPEADEVFARFRTGAVLGEGSGPRSEDVPVAVLNGTDVSGLAGRTAEALVGRGFPVEEVGNADDVDASVIRFPPGQRAGAELVAGTLGRDVELVEDGSVAVVTLVVGRDLADR